jgi:cytochrome c551/c552
MSLHTSPARATWLAALLFAAGTPASANQALASKYGCLGCHAAATRLVGPSYAEVAAKYGKDDAAMLAQAIRNGGSGKWGEVAMPPQKQVSEADAKRLAAWILGGAK